MSNQFFTEFPVENGFNGEELLNFVSNYHKRSTGTLNWQPVLQPLLRPLLQGVKHRVHAW